MKVTPTRTAAVVGLGLLLLGLRASSGTPGPADPPARPAGPLPPMWAVEVATHRAPTPIVAEPTPPVWPTGQLVVDVLDSDGYLVDGVSVVGVDCPGFTGGPPGAYDVEAGVCTLRARRTDGLLDAYGPCATVLIDEQAPAYVALEVPDYRAGGIGVAVEPADDGMRVTEVIPGAPADVLGLAPGDTILAVGGRAVAGLPMETFAAEVVGAVGTAVVLTVAALEDSGVVARRTVRVTRVFLEAGARATRKG